MERPLLEVKGFLGEYYVCGPWEMYFIVYWEQSGQPPHPTSCIGIMRDLLLAGF